MLSKANKLVIKKIISLFSVVRGYNIPIIILAQYLSAIFILAPEQRALNILLDFNLFILVFFCNAVFFGERSILKKI